MYFFLSQWKNKAFENASGRSVSPISRAIWGYSFLEYGTDAFHDLGRMQERISWTPMVGAERPLRVVFLKQNFRSFFWAHDFVEQADFVNYI